MLNWPMSSPQMMRMLGFLSAAWAGAMAMKRAAPAVSSDKLYLRILIFILFFGFTCRP